MHMTMIQFKRYDSELATDICVVRNEPSAKKYAQTLKETYHSYRCGEFFFKKIKFIKV